MANSVLMDQRGVDWPLGYVNVPTAGSPVNIMVNVDANNNQSPQGANASSTGSWPYAPTFQQMQFQGYKPAANNNGMIANTGNVYILRANAATGNNTGNKTDYGVYVSVLAPGQTLFLASGATVNDVWNPYRYALDVDNNNEGALITGLRF